MNRQDIKVLAANQGYPCLTITLPTHRTSPDNRQDAIRLKNLVSQAADRLTSEMGKREASTVLEALEQLAETIDHQQNLDGLALFVSATMQHYYRVPFTLPERVIVDDTFFIRDLVFALNRSPRYWVLALTEQPTRLFEAVHDTLEEVTSDSGFPMSHDGPGGTGGLPRRFGVNHSQFRDDHARAFFRSVDEALSSYMTADPLPIAVVGVDRWQSFFREVTNHNDSILATVNGSHDSTTAHELGKLVWPVMQDALAEKRSEIFGELAQAVNGQRSSSTLGEVWRKAHEGRGQTLIVEESYHAAATLDERGFLQPLADGAEPGPGDLDDAVDEIIFTVLDKGGRVVFVDDDTLSDHNRIAMILRY